MRQRVVVRGNKKVMSIERNGYNYTKWQKTAKNIPLAANPDLVAEFDRKPGGLSDAITEAISNGSEQELSEVERTLFQWHIREGRSVNSCAKELGLHSEQARRLLKKACVKIYSDAAKYMT